VEVDGSLTVEKGHAIGDDTEKAVQRLLQAADVIANLEQEEVDDERLDDLVK
jgi:ferrous-iron efflux pump FieF